MDSDKKKGISFAPLVKYILTRYLQEKKSTFLSFKLQK